jgi:hypothetical protein
MENSLAAFQFMRRDPASAGWRWRYARDTEEGKLLICENEWQPGCHMSLRRKK